MGLFNVASTPEYGQGEGEVLGKVTQGRDNMKVFRNLLDRSGVEEEPADSWAVGLLIRGERP